MFRESFVPRLVLCVCIAVPLAEAQTQQSTQTQYQQQAQPVPGPAGTFTGTLNGAGMDGATVTLTNATTGATKSAVTDENGKFTIPDLAPGTYRAQVTLKSGLKLGEHSIEITSSGANPIQVDLESATTAPGARLELHGKTPTVEIYSAEVSRSYDSDFIRSLPLLDRQNQELITLMPGVSPPSLAGDRIFNPQRVRIFNVNGLPAYANLYNQDGVFDNEPFNYTPARTESSEAVQALEVRTSNYNAEYGTSGGAWSSTVTRPGTNAIHGSLFEFNTNSYFQSGHSLFATQNQPRFNTNQFGGTAGGAVVPDKVFWFLSYEGLIQRGRTESEATVPTPDLASGNFSAIPGLTLYNPNSGSASGAGRVVYPGNIIPFGQLNPAAQQLLGLLPAPNQPGLTNNLVGSVPLLDDNHRVDGKLDERFTEKTTGFLRFGYTDGSVNQGSLLGLAGSPLESGLRAMNAAGSLVQVFGTGVVGELRMGYDRYRNQISPWGNLYTLNGTIAGFPNGVPSINMFGFTPLGLPANVPTKEVANVYDGASNWLVRKGMHSLKFGVDVRELQSSGFANPFFSSLGSFTFGAGATLGSTASGATLTPAVLQANALASFLTGSPTQSGFSSFTTTPAYQQRQYGAYITDTVNLFHRLYLELGVRYDIFMPLQAWNSSSAMLYDPASNTTSTLGINGVGHTYTRTDVNNVAPRVGFAFRPTNRFVFRAGYGIHYFPLPFALETLNLPTTGVQSGIAGGLATTSFMIPTVTTGSATAANMPYFITSRNAPTPYVQTYNAMIQGDLGAGFLMDIGYVGNLGRDLPYTTPLVGLPGTGLAGLPRDGRTALIYEEGRGLTSNYNSLQVNLTKKFSAGLAIAAAYTYSRALDYGTFLMDPYTLSNNYGPADWNRAHILSVSHVWRLPFGVQQKYLTNGWAARALGDWEFTGILRWATGTPYTVTADPLACACLGVTAVPATFAGGAGLNGSSSFNPALFSTPTAGTFGTLSRNSILGPDFFTYNASLFRNFAIRENIKLEFRGEVYNLTNTTNAANPVASAAAPGFGSSLGTLDGLAGRQFQVALRLLF